LIKKRGGGETVIKIENKIYSGACAKVVAFGILRRETAFNFLRHSQTRDIEIAEKGSQKDGDLERVNNQDKRTPAKFLIWNGPGEAGNLVFKRLHRKALEVKISWKRGKKRSKGINPPRSESGQCGNSTKKPDQNCRY